MNQSAILTQIGYRFRTASRNFVTTDEIKAELNRSLDRLTNMVDLELSIRTTTISYTADGDYALPSDFKKPIQFFDRTNNVLYKRVTRAQLYQDEDNSIAQYAISGTNISVESYSGTATITLTYYSTYDATESTGVTLQKGLTLSTDIPLLQARFHDYFVEDVSAVIFRKQRKYDDYKIARGEADTILDEINTDNITQKEFVYQTLTPYPEDYT